MNLLTICIPTYKRPNTLRRCINSIAAQIKHFGLEEQVLIYVTNDASPDNTTEVLDEFNRLSYFKGVTREQNLGMSVNIKCMLMEVAKGSDYQLIMTDDDYLQPDMLGEIVKFLREQQNDSNRAPAIWTPRYSYTEDDKLHCVVCNPFKDNSFINPSAANAGKYMNNGFVLSGLILRAECVDYQFWEEYKENAFFPMIFFADLLFRSGGYYWNKNIVHHTVLNECHWERWGKNDVVIALRLFTDYVNAFGIMAKKLNQFQKAALFYLSSFPSIRNRVDHFLLSEKFTGDRQMTMDAIYELQAQQVLKFSFQLRLLMVCTIHGIAIAIIKLIIRLKLALLILGNQKRELRREAYDAQFKRLRFMPIMLKIILS